MTPMYTNALFSELDGAGGGKSGIYMNSACIGQRMNAILARWCQFEHLKGIRHPKTTTPRCAHA
jgi:hypothetical protein